MSSLSPGGVAQKVSMSAKFYTKLEYPRVAEG
jgi:hypothetical protein